MSIGNRQIGWSNESNLLWEIGKKLERLIQVAGPAPTPPPPPPIPPALKLTIVANFPVVDPSDVSLWNTLLGSSFTSVDIIGVDIYLRGGGPFNMLASALNFSELVVIDDQINSVLSVSTDSLANNPILNVIKLPALTSIDDVTSFTGSGTGVDVYATVYLPNCTSIGPTVGDDGVFLNVFTFGGATITITIPASLMTCDAGNPDGDIQFLQANNTVIVVTV
jgi:hypothetical protein